MELTPCYATCLMILTAVSLLVYAVGHVLMSMIVKHDGSEYLYAFEKFTIGTISTIAVYSMCRTGGNSISTGVAVLLLMAVAYLIKNKSISIHYWVKNIIRIDFKALLLYMFYLTIVYTLFYLMVVGVGDANTVIPYDFSFHSAVGNVIDSYNVETNNVVYGFDGVDSGRFYHFTEIWYGVMVHGLFGISVYYAMMLVVVPLVVANVLLGCYVLTINLIKERCSVWLFLLPLLLLLPMRNIGYPLLMMDIRLGSANLDGLLSDYAARVIFIYLGLVWFFVSVNKRFLFERLFPLSMLCILYPPIMPAVVAGVGLYLIIRYLHLKLKHDRLGNHEFAYSWLLMLVVVMFVVSYLWANQTGENRSVGMADIVKTYYSDGSNIVMSIKLLAKKIVMTAVWISISGGLLLLIWHYKKSEIGRYLESLGICLCVIISGLLGFVAVWFITDSFQIYELPLFTIVPFATFIAVCLLINSRSKRWFVSGLCFVGIVIMSYILIPKNASINYSSAYQLRSFIDGDKYSVAYIDNDTMRRNVSSVMESTEFYHVRRVSDSFLPVSLFTFDRDEDVDEVDFKAIWNSDEVTAGYRFNGDVESSPFYKYAMTHRDVSLNDCKIMFIKEHEIDYIVCNAADNWIADSNLPIDSVLRFENGKQILKLKW